MYRRRRHRARRGGVGSYRVCHGLCLQSCIASRAANIATAAAQHAALRASAADGAQHKAATAAEQADRVGCCIGMLRKRALRVFGGGLLLHHACGRCCAKPRATGWRRRRGCKVVNAQRACTAAAKSYLASVTFPALTARPGASDSSRVRDPYLKSVRRGRVATRLQCPPGRSC
jgi:hypothetical protein